VIYDNNNDELDWRSTRYVHHLTAFVIHVACGVNSVLHLHKRMVFKWILSYWTEFIWANEGVVLCVSRRLA